jgi:hypothetical protein
LTKPTLTFLVITTSNNVVVAGLEVGSRVHVFTTG